MALIQTFATSFGVPAEYCRIDYVVLSKNEMVFHVLIYKDAQSRVAGARSLDERIVTVPLTGAYRDATFAELYDVLKDHEPFDGAVDELVTSVPEPIA